MVRLFARRSEKHVQRVTDDLCDRPSWANTVSVIPVK